MPARGRDGDIAFSARLAAVPGEDTAELLMTLSMRPERCGQGRCGTGASNAARFGLSTLGAAMTRDEESRFLVAGAGDMGVILDAPQCESLLRLVDELQAGNAQFNLTAIRDRPGMLRKHVLDSLSLQPYLRGAQWQMWVPGPDSRACRSPSSTRSGVSR